MKMDSMKAEVTVALKGGAVIHVHENSDHMFASVDLVAHKLAHAVRRHRDKIKSNDIKRHRQEKMLEEDDVLGESLEADDPEDVEVEVAWGPVSYSTLTLLLIYMVESSRH